jgi:NADH-quinone oxidoreductase subunit L
MSREVAHHVHESPAVMTLPLVLLAVLTAVAGLALGIPSAQGTPFARFLAPTLPLHPADHGGLGAKMVLAASVGVAVVGIALAWLAYGRRPVDARVIGVPGNALHRLLLDKYYVDEIYDLLVVRPCLGLAEWCARVFDLRLIDGAVNGVGRLVTGWAQALRRIQTGFVMNYALTMLAGAVMMVAYLLSR